MSPSKTAGKVGKAKAAPAKTQAKPRANSTTIPVPPKAKEGAKAPAKVSANVTAKAPARPAKGALAPDVADADPTLFDPLTPGEIADALRTLTEDRRLLGMAKVGRYRIICTEPHVVKPPHWMSGHRLARVVAYDYAADRAVDACIDLDEGVVAHLEITRAQPMLSREEEALAVSIATVDDRVRANLTIGDEPQVTTQYWGRTDDNSTHTRRSAAVVFGRAGGHPHVVAVVDLIDNTVTHVVPAEQW